MDARAKAAFRQAAAGWLQQHIDRVNRRERQGVIDDLFAVPGMKYTGRESYADSMVSMAPVVLLNATVADPDERDTRHGRVLASWVEATIQSKTGEESTDEFPIWWLERSASFVIAGRPSRWIAR
jgi:hypothetical protein